MLLPIKWAKEYVDINDDIMNICDNHSTHTVQSLQCSGIM